MHYVLNCFALSTIFIEQSMFNINNLKLSFYWTIYWNQPSSKKLQFEEFSQLKQKVQQQKQAV